MRDYFELLGVTPDMDLESIEKKISEANRKWTRASSSAARMEDRRDAEDNLMLLPEIKDVFSSEENKQKYIAKLEAWKKDVEKLDELDNMSADTPQDIPSIYKQSVELLNNKEYGRAYQKARVIVQQAPKNIEASKVLCRAYLGGSNKNKTMRDYCINQALNVLNLKQDEQETLSCLGDLYFECNDWQNAYDTYGKILFRGRENNEKMGISCYKLGNIGRSADFLEEALLPEGNNPEVLAYLADAWAHRAFWSLGRYSYEQTGSTEFSIPDNYYFKGSANFRSGKEHLDKIRSTCPPEIWKNNQNVKKLKDAVSRSNGLIYTGKPGFKGALSFIFLGILASSFNQGGLSFGLVVTGLLCGYFSFSRVYKILDS